MFNLRIILPVVAVGAFGCVNAVTAADLPVKAPILAVIPFSWSGCYVGANAGWKGGRFLDELARVPATTGNLPGFGQLTVVADRTNLDNTNSNSGAAGVQGGCRWETAQQWVFGTEGDFDWTNLGGNVVNRVVGTTFAPGYNFDDHARWESSARLTAGRAFDRLLVYGTGGVAFSDVTMTGHFIPTMRILANGFPGLYPGSTELDFHVLTGGTIGAGLAYALGKNWEIGGEYRYTRYQGADYGLGRVAGLCGISQVGMSCLNQDVSGHKSLETNEVLLRANYRFDWAGPLVAQH